MIPLNLSKLLNCSKAVLDSALQAVEIRVGLFSVELREETRRFFRLILWAGALVAVGSIALVLVALALLFTFWNVGPAQALGGLAALYLFGTLFLYLQITKKLAGGRPPFCASLQEIKRDRAVLGAHADHRRFENHRSFAPEDHYGNGNP